MDEARRVFLQGRKLFPHDKRFPLELAGIAQRNKDSASAKRYLLEALKLDPKDSYGNEFLANLYLLEGNLPSALRYWNRVNKPLIQTFNLDPAPHLDPVLRERALEISPGQLFTLARLEAT
jgi:tetratricopeptide (TPR) repeat protein